MDIKIDVECALASEVSADQLLVVLSDLDATLKKFPKLKKLSKIDGQSYRIDIQTIGSSVAKIAHDASFGAKFAVDQKKAEMRWTPVPGVGNAQLEGCLRHEGSKLTMRVKGEIKDVPVPLMYRLVAPAFIKGKFSALADTWLERLAEAAGSKTTRDAA